VRVTPATPEDIDGFLLLAAEVENWFGPMVDDPDFHAVLRKNIERGTALVVRAPNGTSLLGGMLTGDELRRGVPSGPRCSRPRSRTAGAARRE
jgi:hypothetical protein